MHVRCIIHHYCSKGKRLNMFDLIILGGGPAGYLAAERAGAAGLKTLLIEKNHLGGVCLNEGCVPSKTILNSAKYYSNALHGAAFGVTASNVTFDLTVAMARKQKVIEMLRKGIAATLKKYGVTVVSALGEILPKKGDAFCVKAHDIVHEGAKLLICSGSEAIRPPIPGADQPFVMTNKEVLSVTKIPATMVVIGGGVIGLELATFFAEVGAKVTVVEMLPSIGGMLDSDIAGILQKEMEKMGVTFKLNAKVTGIGDHTVTFTLDNATQTVDAEYVLLSVGRRAVTKGFGLESLNVFCERGAVVTNEQGRTNIPGVWAAGDVNGKSMLAHTAYREGEVCINDILGKSDRMRYNAIPGVIYTHPEVASVGLTKEEAEKQGKSVICGKLPLSFNGRYLAETDAGRGICKVIVDKEYGTILGVHIIGSACSEMIYGAAIMIEQELRVDDIKEIVFPHPTVSEIIKDTLLSITH